MIITKKALSRRTVLKALGVTLPLPFLDAMVPAGTALAQTAAKPILRFGVAYVPNGVIPGRWFPATEGSAFELSPTLAPLESYREQLLVLGGLDSVPPPPPGERQYNNHADASTRFLTDVTPSRKLRAGISLDAANAENSPTSANGQAATTSSSSVPRPRSRIPFCPAPWTMDP